MAKLRRETSAPTLALDGGALLFEEMRLAPAQEAQARATAKGIVEAYNLMGYQAVGVSRYDLAGGLDFLREMAAASEFSWLSANLVDRANRQPLFPPYLVTKAGGLTLGIIGVTAPGGPPLDGAIVLPWQETLPPLISELEPATDFIILLADLDRPQIERIGAVHPAVNLVIQAGGDAANLAPELAHQSLICRTAKQGKYLGVLAIDWQGRPDWGQSPEELLLDRKRALDRLDWHLRHLPESPALQEERKHLVEEIATLAASDRVSSYRNEFLAMEVSLPDEPEVAAVVGEIRQEIHRLGQEASRQEQSAGGKEEALPSYVGWQACARCHPSETHNWQRTAHAASYRTLAAKQQQFNLNCLPCHVTGIRKETAAALALPEGRQAVGCETCHGPGGEHVRAGGTSQLRLRPAAEDCLRCHTPEQDDDFNFERDLKRAAHPE